MAEDLTSSFAALRRQNAAQQSEAEARLIEQCVALARAGQRLPFLPSTLKEKVLSAIHAEPDLQGVVVEFATKNDAEAKARIKTKLARTQAKVVFTLAQADDGTTFQ